MKNYLKRVYLGPERAAAHVTKGQALVGIITSLEWSTRQNTDRMQLNGWGSIQLNSILNDNMLYNYICIMSTTDITSRHLLQLFCSIRSDDRWTPFLAGSPKSTPLAPDLGAELDEGPRVAIATVHLLRQLRDRVLALERASWMQRTCCYLWGLQGSSEVFWLQIASFK